MSFTFFYAGQTHKLNRQIYQKRIENSLAHLEAKAQELAADSYKEAIAKRAQTVLRPRFSRSEQQSAAPTR